MSHFSSKFRLCVKTPQAVALHKSMNTPELILRDFLTCLGIVF